LDRNRLAVLRKGEDSLAVVHKNTVHVRSYTISKLPSASWWTVGACSASSFTIVYIQIQCLQLTTSSDQQVSPCSICSLQEQRLGVKMAAADHRKLGTLPFPEVVTLLGCFPCSCWIPKATSFSVAILHYCIDQFANSTV